MHISILVPAFNEERLLAGSIAAIRDAAAGFEKHGWTYELIVCDNNSSDRTADIAREAGAQVVFEPVNQIARARNAGAAVASGDWLLFIDADSRPSAALFAEVAEQILTGRVIGGGTTIRVDHDRGIARLICGIWNLVSRTNQLMAGSFIFVEAAAFREIGGFSQEWYAAEELDFCQRLKKRARLAKRRVAILHRNPIVTSARKIDLYTPWEMLRIVVGAVTTGGRSLRSRETTQLWYDGRR